MAAMKKLQLGTTDAYHVKCDGCALMRASDLLRNLCEGLKELTLVLTSPVMLWTVPYLWSPRARALSIEINFCFERHGFNKEKFENAGNLLRGQSPSSFGWHTENEKSFLYFRDCTWPNVERMLAEMPAFERLSLVSSYMPVDEGTALSEYCSDDKKMEKVVEEISRKHRREMVRHKFVSTIVAN